MTDLQSFQEMFRSEYRSEELELKECGRERCASEKYNAPMTRDIYVMHLCVDGKGYFRTDGNQYTVKKGDIFLISPNHQVEYFPDKEHPWTYFWLGFSGSNSLSAVSKCGFNKTPVIKIDIDALMPRFAEIVDIYNSEGSITLECLGIFFIILSKLMKNESDRREKTISVREAHLREAINYLKFNMDNNKVTVNDLAASLQLSPIYVINMFSETLNITPKQFLIDYRLNTAKGHLSAGLSVSETSVKVGYTNPEQFSKSFKQKFGISPKMFQKRSSK